MAALVSMHLLPVDCLSEVLEVTYTGTFCGRAQQWLDRPAEATEPLRTHMTMSLRTILAEQAAGRIPSDASMAAADVGAALAAAQVCLCWSPI